VVRLVVGSRVPLLSFSLSSFLRHEFAEWCKLKDELPLGRVGYAMLYLSCIGDLRKSGFYYIDRSEE